jgi:RNA polymerase sigma-70 factor, ECF subfamily
MTTPMTCEVEASTGAQPRSPRSSTPRPDATTRVLDPDRLPDHIDRLYRAAWALCGSRHDAEDLVQETFVNVLKRPRLLRDNNEIGYLLRALKNTHANRYRAAARRPATRQLLEDDAMAQEDGNIAGREIMEAIANIPPPFRDAVIAVDLVGLSYREAARSLLIREATLTTRLHRGRQRVARELSGETAAAA